jgi:3-hydroxybutyryl-CoA dehydrogenase
MTETESIKQVAIIGTGMIGSDVTLYLAMRGLYPIMVGRTDESVDRGLSRIRGNMKELVDEGVFTDRQAEEIIARITTTVNLDEAVTEADLVLEAVIEDLEVKQNLFAVVEKAAPDRAIIASCTSGLSPNDIGEQCKRKENIMVTHFWNPPYLVPLVELVAHDNSSDHVKGKLIGFLESLGKKPVLLKRDILGHIGNRLQHAMFREAAELIDRGVAGAEEIDRVVKYGFGPRYSRIGPMEYVDSVGLDLQVAIESYLFEALSDAKKPQKPLTDRYDAGYLGMKTGKGFYDWSERDPGELIKRKNREYIIRLEQPW